MRVRLITEVYRSSERNKANIMLYLPVRQSVVEQWVRYAHRLGPESNSLRVILYIVLSCVVLIHVF